MAPALSKSLTIPDPDVGDGDGAGEAESNGAADADASGDPDGAADADGRITVFNQEAAQIAGLNTNGAERTIDDLPAPLRDIIRTTLSSGERQEDRE